MINVLINAYAISPIWGSEQGMGWNWVINLSRYCHIDVITEGEWKEEITFALKDHPYRENITFHYLPVKPGIREMCWNQGDWRFYFYYERWQRRALKKAEEICSSKRIDVLHQLNMIGFREPGYLWKIPDIPFVWGPIGGMDLMPMQYLRGASLKHRIFNTVKNKINEFQYRYSSRVRKALNRASILISAVSGVQKVISNIHHKNSILINETGVTIDHNYIKRKYKKGTPFKLLWIGKFDFRKQLPLALKSIQKSKITNLELHICGTGNSEEVRLMKRIAEQCGVSQQCIWHGKVSHDKILGMMAESDLLFFTSIMEATSTVVPEAISVGLPVLSFNTCGYGSIVKEFAGYTIELSDPEKSADDFAVQLIKIYSDREALDKKSELILANRESMTWEAKALKTFCLYKECLKNNN